MSVTLFEATAEHECSKKNCPHGKKILVGDRAVKTTATRGNCGGSYRTTVYFHEDCWQSRSRK